MTIAKRFAVLFGFGLLAVFSPAASFAVLQASDAASANPEAALARQILDATGTAGGLVVHLGSGDGKLTAALRPGDGFLVHGLDADPANVARARRHVRSLGLYGPVSVDRLDGRHLPYVDNTVNLVVADGLGDVPPEEVIRVLCPNGAAYVKQGGRWTKTVKPRPAEIDEWTHYLHDPTNNAVAHDAAIEPPRHLQWTGGPRYSRHHDHMSSSSAIVSAGGRNFYIFDEGSKASILLPSDWQLIARDAFNGKILWKRAIDRWHTQLWRLKSGPADLPRRLVAAGDTVYTTLSLHAPLVALDAASGRTLRVYEGTFATEEILYSDGVLLLVVDESPGDQPGSPKEYEYRTPGGPRCVMAVEAASGRILWKKPFEVVAPLTLTADSQRVLLFDGLRIVCLDRTSGREAWQSEVLGRRFTFPSYFGPTLVIYDDVVLFSGTDTDSEEYHADNGKTMTALDAATGRTLWQAEHPPSGYRSPEDILVLGGLVWCGALFNSSDSGVHTGRDLHTGEVKAEFPPDVDTHWFHHRCYRAKATDKYLLTSRTGIEFVDVGKQHWECHHWVRGACLYGIMPANGMIYVSPHPCACYLEAKLYGFNALAPAAPSREVPGEVADEDRLERGPAYGRLPSPGGRGSDWPTYRSDAARSGSTTTAVPVELGKAWQTDLGGKLTSLVAAEGKVFVAAVDAHAVHALDADAGTPAWSFTAGGRVDSPPTIHAGTVLFGSADGCVYCLKAADGELVWRFRAAPVDRRLVACEQVESVWPVHGSVLVEDGIVWCAAGRSMFLDGGIRLLRLDAATGRKLSETILDDRDPESGENLQVRLKGLNMPVALPDVLSSDGRYVYMRSQRFDRQGVRLAIETPTGNVSQQRGEGAHLFCPTGFLDDDYWHRSYWVYGQRWASGAGGYYRAGRYAPSGRLLVFDDSTVYGFSRTANYFRWTTPLERQLFASSKEPEVLRIGPKPPKGFSASRPPDMGIAWNWSQDVPLHARALVLAGQTLFVAGPPDVVDEEEALAGFGTEGVQARLAEQNAAMEGEQAALLLAAAAADGRKLAEIRLDGLPVFDGMIAAGGKLYISMSDGRVLCLAGR